MTQSPFEIDLVDPGEGNRLGLDERRSLRDQLKQARKDGAPAIAVRVAGNAWFQDTSLVTSYVSADEISKSCHGLVVDVFSLEVPVVVHLAGTVTGLGLALALACDVRFADADTRLGLGDPETSAALVSGAPWLLGHRVGSALAADLAWTGRCLDANEAQRVGLVSGLSSDPRTASTAARRLSAVPRGATSTLKRSLNARLVGELTDQLDYDSWLATVSVRSVS